MADTSVFTRLRRLFSTDVVIRNEGGNQLKVIDTDSIQRSGRYETNSLIDRYNRIYSSNATSLYGQQLNVNYQYLRAQIYSDYDVMDTDAIISSALDIIADECSLKNEMGEVLQIRSSDEDIQKILYNLFYDVLNIEFNLWSWVRQMCKYGDFFLKLEIAEKFGVYNVLPYTAYHIERQEGYDKESPTSVRFKYNPEGYVGGGYGQFSLPSSYKTEGLPGIYFDNYEMAHFRLLTDVNYLPYGRSYIEPARKLFKQYSLMEDAMLIHRIVRAPEKRIFYINVGAIPPNEVENFMKKTIATMRKTPYVDEKTGEYNLKFNMQNMMEDFFIPVRGNDQTTKIEPTKGLEYTGMDDVNYLRDKLFAALKVPKAFMGYEKDLSGKATLAAEDIRFARTIDRIQRIILAELYKIALVHLYTQGYKGETLTNFELSLTTPSIIYDKERIALMKEKVELAKNIMEAQLLPSDWIYHHIFHFSEDQFDEYRDLILQDAKRKFRLAQVTEEGNDPLETGRSYGTPHDLATLYGKGRMVSDPGNVPTGYGDDVNLGRPKEKVSNINTQGNPFGRDRLGKKDMKNDDMSDMKSLNESKNTYLKNKQFLNEIEKKLVFQTDKSKESLLDENQLRD